MKIKINFKFFIFFLFFFKYVYCYEIIRDPIFEDYFAELNKDLQLKHVNVYLLSSEIENAFVINENMYFTTGLFKAIYLHEYGHIIKNHFQAKKIKTQQSSNKRNFYNLFTIGIAVLSGSPNIGIGASITLDTKIVSEISKHSIKYEIEADDYMIEHIRINKINTSELILFLKNTSDSNNKYFRTHPKSEDRINNLNKLDFKKSNNSKEFEWLKSKYSKNSKNNTFNNYFDDLEKGIFNYDQNIENINNLIMYYEAFKKGILIKNWEIKFKELLEINNSPFLKIEYINFILDNNLHEYYYFIEELKFNNDIMQEYFYNYIFGKYYNKINNHNLSNFYFCQFYKSINSQNKADFFCKKYDIKYIPTLDKSYALFK